MGGGVISETNDSDLIKKIATMPELWKTVAEDGINPETWSPDLTEGWLIASDEEGFVGLYNVHPNNGTTLQIHPLIPPEIRGKRAYRSAREVLKWIFGNTKYQKVVCQIPVIYRNVKLFAMQSGMKEEGLNRKSYLKNGKIHDQWHLGIAKQEFEL
jgi:RimJ/RimL family protein N-acetyltransferase